MMILGVELGMVVTVVKDVKVSKRFCQFGSYELQFVILNTTLKNVISGTAKNTPNRAFMIIRCFVYALGPVCAVECVYNSSLVLKCLGS